MIYYAAIPKETYAAYPNAHAAEHDAALKLLGYALKKEYGIESLPEMTCGEHGKPYFKNADIKFNLSHCSGLAVCVVSSGEVGIDCEKTGRVSLKAAGRIFSPYENEMLEKLTGEEQARFFSYVWTAKEAYCKATGQGLFSGLSQLDFGDSISEYGGFYFAKHIFIQNNAEYIITAACREPHFDYFKAIPHKDCVRSAPSDFSSDRIKAPQEYRRISK